MSVHYESTNFGDIRAIGIHGRSGVGLSELLFSLEWSIDATRQEVLSVFGTSAWISVQASGVDQATFLGHAYPETAWCSETRNHATSSALHYRLALPSPQMLAIEELRHGRELVFTIDIRGNSFGPRGVRSFDQKVTHRTTVSDWIRVLREADAADILLVGVHMPGARMSAPLKSAAELVRRANDHLILGHYSAAVADCRLAIESIWKAANLREKATDSRKLLANMGQQMTMTKRQRELALGEALRIFCHTAHHVGDDAAPEEFGRVDAALAVGTTAALVSTFASDPDLVTGGHTVINAKAKTKTSQGDGTKSQESSGQVDRVALAIEHLKNRPSNRPASITALRSLLDTLFRKKLPGEQVEEVVAELTSRGIIRLNGKRLEYELSLPG
jgi:hypothetical protein